LLIIVCSFVFLLNFFFALLCDSSLEDVLEVDVDALNGCKESSDDCEIEVDACECGNDRCQHGDDDCAEHERMKFHKLPLHRSLIMLLLLLKHLFDVLFELGNSRLRREIFLPNVIISCHITSSAHDIQTAISIK